MRGLKVASHAHGTIGIKNAIEALFEVPVDKVATQTRKGKPRRYKFTYGQTKSWKKAIVKLKGDAKIDFF